MADTDWQRIAEAIRCRATTSLVQYLDDRVGPVRCDLIEGHYPGTEHRARIGGKQRATWTDTEVTLLLGVGVTRPGST